MTCIHKSLSHYSCKNAAITRDSVGALEVTCFDYDILRWKKMVSYRYTQMINTVSTHHASGNICKSLAQSINCEQRNAILTATETGKFVSVSCITTKSRAMCHGSTT